ncbi:MAG TPA: EamA family transporter [Streptosporangiaceae bacterium]|nr:EamA family transporter [Streptosporangiaceae bacterium]
MGAAVLSLQSGAGVAGRLFATVSPAGLTELRLWGASLMLAGLGARPAARAAAEVLAKRAWRDATVVAGFGLTLAVMNFAIYQSFARIPLGIAVTIEFLGPLAVAIASSRRPVDLLWVALAGTGVALLGTAGVSPKPPSGPAAAGSQAAAVAAGIGFALLAATSWACYILLSRATGKRFGGSSGLAISMAIGAIAIIPLAAAAGGDSASLLRPSVLAAALAIALLSSVIPYIFELEALRRVPPRVFGIWMSLEPAVAALAGVVLLGQSLLAGQWLAIGCVVVASAGAALATPCAPPPTMGSCPPKPPPRQPSPHGRSVRCAGSGRWPTCCFARLRVRCAGSQPLAWWRRR